MSDPTEPKLVEPKFVNYTFEENRIPYLQIDTSNYDGDINIAIKADHIREFLGHFERLLKFINQIESDYYPTLEKKIHETMLKPGFGTYQEILGYLASGAKLIEAYEYVFKNRGIMADLKLNENGLQILDQLQQQYLILIERLHDLNQYGLRYGGHIHDALSGLILHASIENI